MVERGKIYHESHLIWIHINNHKRPMVEMINFSSFNHWSFMIIYMYSNEMRFLINFSSFNHWSFMIIYMYSNEMWFMINFSSFNHWSFMIIYMYSNEMWFMIIPDFTGWSYNNIKYDQNLSNHHFIYKWKFVYSLLSNKWSCCGLTHTLFMAGSQSSSTYILVLYLYRQILVAYKWHFIVNKMIYVTEVCSIQFIRYPVHDCINFI
jgi:hypothetical protein